MPVTFLMDERRVIFLKKKMSHYNNALLFTLSKFCLQQQIVSLGYKYGIDKPLRFLPKKPAETYFCKTFYQNIHSTIAENRIHFS